MRSGASTTSSAGIEILGMRFFRETIATEASIVVQTPGGVLSLLLQSLHRAKSWFFSSHYYTATSLAGLSFDTVGGARPLAETNLILQTQEGDKNMPRDKIIDHLDGLIVSVAGFAALEVLEVKGNRMEQYVREQCPRGLTGDEAFYEGCNIRLIEEDAELARLRSEAMDEFQFAIGHLDPPMFELMAHVANLRLVAQQIEDRLSEIFHGPSTSIVVDNRFDDAALAEIMTQRTGEDLKQSVLNFIKAAQSNRLKNELAANRETIATRADDELNELRAIFDGHADAYRRLMSLETAEIEGLGHIGSQAIEIRFEVDRRKNPIYKDAVSQSLAQARAQVTTRLFLDLLDVAEDFPTGPYNASAPHAEQLVSYGLLGLSSPERMDLRVEFDTKLNCFLCNFDRYEAAGYEDMDIYRQGSAVELIGGGSLFDIDLLTNFD